jgi:uroporphyrinogen decarboxylase
MKPRDAVRKAFAGEKPDRVPVALIGGGMWSAMHAGTTFKDLSRDAQGMSDMLVTMAERLKSDIVYAGSGYPNLAAAAFGGHVKYREVGAVDLDGPVVASEEELARLDLSQVDRDPVLQCIRRAFALTRARIGDEYLVTLTAWGPFTLGARMVGEENLIRAVLKMPANVETVLAWATELLIRLFGPLVDDGGLEVITLGDPTASGDLISRKQFERFALPCLQRFTAWAQSKGAMTLLHICGNTTDRLDLFPRTGADCISLDHKTDMVKAKEVLHGRICFAGNIDPVSTLLQGSPEAVETACETVIRTVGTDGGFVLMPGCDIPPTVPIKNIQAFVQSAHRWRG